MKNIPEIRIKDAWLLRRNTSEHLNELWGNGEPMLSDEKYTEIAEAYKVAWMPYERKVLEAMTDLTGLEFRQDIVDVYIAPWFNAFSDPMVIGITRTPEEFVDILTHELIHRLLLDNNKLPHDYKIANEWYKLFGDKHSFGCLVHIPVHAIHQSIYIDVLDEPHRLKNDLDDAKTGKDKDYQAAWDYVSEHGYKEIIEQLRSSYKSLSSD